MNKILGIFGLLLFVGIFTSVLSSSFDTAYNMYNVARWSATFGVISIGAAFVIITGGIDLSVGSLISLAGCMLVISIKDWGLSIYAALALVMAFSMGIGLVHGLFITKLKLQPFVVTLFGFLVYRGLARWLASDQPQGFGQDHRDGLRQLAIGKPWIGYEANLAFMFAVAGALFAIYFIWRIVQPANEGTTGRSTSIVGFAFSTLITAIGCSQFLGGENPLVMRIAGMPIELEPATLLFYVGLLIFIPTSLWTVFRAVTAKESKAIVPTIALFVSAAVFGLVAWRAAPIFEQISPGDVEQQTLGFIQMQGKNMRNFVMLLVFLSTGALMGTIGWLGSAVSKIDKSMRPVLLAVVASGVMWLVGMTKLPSTSIPMPLLILTGCAIVGSIFLNQTIYGRYLLALGRNEEAARYSGINTDRMVILAYVICSGMAGLGAILFALDINNLQPVSHGNIYELYAIAAAVLGGCSLRGGEGTILGVIIGAAVMRTIYNAINTLGIDTKLEWFVLGIVILAGVVADEMVKRVVAAKRAKLQTQET